MHTSPMTMDSYVHRARLRDMLVAYANGEERAMELVARLFTNGRSQAVRIPAPFRFEGDSVYVRRDEATGDVILSQRPSDWSGLFAALDGLDVPDGFLQAPADLPPADVL